jgi:hypothetical protein
VYFQSLPGHFVTGSFYRSKGGAKDGAKRPAVLCPHGHWPKGRYHDNGVDETRRQIAQGAERFEVGGRHPLQARCVQLARMGCVVFIYDMEGFADSVQLDHRLGVRDEMNTPTDWGFFSAQAELRMQNLMGLQTWNSVRALDFVLSLPDVDPKRVAVTGASGGGTQTFMLFAIDDRPLVSFPAVMVSTAMQGGCVCENAPYLRIGAGNIDIAALAAPRPMGMTGANDWTKEILTKGFPELKNLYRMVGHEGNVHAEAFPHFEHNYNSVSRTVMYNWVNRHLGLGQAEPVIERDFEPLSDAETSVWDTEPGGKHPKPSGNAIGHAHERALLRWFTEDARKQIDALMPTHSKSLAEYRRVVGGAFDVLLGRRLEDVGDVEVAASEKSDGGDHWRVPALISLREKGEQVPVLFLHPKRGISGGVVIWLDADGKAGLLDSDGAAKPAIKQLLGAGLGVIGVDLLYQGESLKDEQPLTRTRLFGYPLGAGEPPETASDPWRLPSAVYTFGYNYPMFAQRMHDVLTVIRAVRTSPLPIDNTPRAKRIHLVGLGPVVGPLAAAARAQAGGAIDKAAIDTGGFRFASLDRLDDPMFLPGAVKYGDVPALLALGAPNKLWLAGERESPGVVVSAFRASGQPGAFRGSAGERSAVATEVVDWLGD